MSILRDFLREKGLQDNQIERRKKRDQWVASVNELMASLLQWLKAADPDGILEVAPIEVDRLEQGIGAYRAPSLEIRFEEADVKIIPIGRNVMRYVNSTGSRVVNAMGRVDITDGARKYTLYRVVDDQGRNRWQVIGEGREGVELDQGCFEQIMKELLS